MPHTALGMFNYFGMLVTALVAVWRGRAAVRLTGAMLALSTLAYPLFQDRLHWSNPFTPFLAIDVLQLVWLIWAGAFVGGPWLIVAAAFQLLEVMAVAGHLYAFWVVGPYVYLTMVIVWSWGVHLSVLGGALAPNPVKLAPRVAPDN